MSLALSEKLRSEGERALTFFAALTPEQWNAPVYTEGETWTVRSVLAHFVTAERGFLKIFADILAGGPGSSDDFDINRYNASQQAKTADLPPAELLALFGQTRAEMVDFAAGLSEADLQKTGRHPALGISTLGEMLKLVYLHNSMHFRDLKKALEK
ncbi:MAG: hypothetical protein CO094_09095 [Anaerolineae bacterium CG_4_9_14_3_um_filter_57_17]|nr:DinB family protein [bacterium]NCT19789.1 DinB family protein [bacterium]OIO85495.1 MAG: hypothetical protein AUK01_05935 [Anaerolineae bacterium CG2_30_57_67]PJB65694.1 MAG: hypothetical protein CO094_09095 [Anaerolineae bacterium CG_4_9_14_3_um_filter_57_17]